MEVSPERQIESRDLSNLLDNIPQTAKNRLVDVETLSVSWNLLDKEYGNHQEIRAKLKASITAIKIKANNGPNKLIELFEQVQTISAKIKAAGDSSQLNNDSEYITLVARHLEEKYTERWIDEESKTWSNFYLFLERLASKAKEMLVLNNIVKALGFGDNFKDDTKRKCVTSGKFHSGICQKAKAVVLVKPMDASKSSPLSSESGSMSTASAASSSCKVCSQPSHTFKDKFGKTRYGKRLLPVLNSITHLKKTRRKSSSPSLLSIKSVGTASASATRLLIVG